MMRVKKPTTWTAAQLYQQFAISLLKANPGAEESVEVKIKSGMSGSNVRYKTILRKVKVGGYWSRYNKKRNISHFWIYTRVRSASGQWKIIEVMNYTRWTKVMESYFTAAREYIIMGEALNLQNRLGYIEPRHIERDHKNKQVNFHQTSLQPKVFSPERGKMVASVVIYHTDDTYARIAWRKVKQVPGERSYEFVPTHGDEKGDGFRQQFSEANERNPALKYSYPWYPYIPKTTQTNGNGVHIS